MKKLLTMKVNKGRKCLLGFCMTAMVWLYSNTVFAEKIKDSKIAKGTEKLISDATSWLMILAPTVGVLCIIYFLIRRGMSDEMEHKKWTTRVGVALISTIGAVLAAVIVNVLVSYYK